jgi:hypothetical protein
MHIYAKDKNWWSYTSTPLICLSGIYRTTVTSSFILDSFVLNVPNSPETVKF